MRFLRRTYATLLSSYFAREASFPRLLTVAWGNDKFRNEVVWGKVIHRGIWKASGQL